jgi:ATP-dependent DNA ligase
MENLPTLYSRTNTGATQQWTIFINGNEYFTEHGQNGGKIQRSEPTIAVPTNEGRSNHRNAHQQARFEARATWDKKQKSGGYFTDIKDIDVQKFTEPTLAKKFLDRKDKISYPCFSQIKFNGVRCVATKDGLFSRKGEKFLNAQHVEESLIKFFEKFPDAVLDGELMCEGYKQELNETMKLIRRTVNISQQQKDDSKKLVRYFIYDLYGCFGVKKTDCYTKRGGAINLVVKDNPYCIEVKSVLCKNEDEVFNHFNSLINDNEEGSIIRLLNQPYENKRSSALLKLKSEDDDEAIITDITEGMGNWAGTGKRISLKWRGIEFDATFKGTYEQAVEFLKNKNQWIGKTVTFLYNGLTGLKVPQYARVDYNNCLKS